VHAANTTDIAWSVKDGARRVIHVNTLRELRAVRYGNTTARCGSIGMELVVKESPNEFIQARLTNMHCELMDVSRYLAN
jgi:hypothetical protein